MNRTHLAMAFAFLALLFNSAMATRTSLADGQASIDWGDLSLNWLSPGAVLVALILGFLIRRLVFRKGKPVDQLEEVAPGPDNKPETMEELNRLLHQIASQPGSTANTVSAESISPHPVQESEMRIETLFVPGTRVSVAGDLYRGPGTVKVVKDGKVFVKCDDDGYRSYTQTDHDLGVLTVYGSYLASREVASAQPKAPVLPSMFRQGDLVDVKGGSYVGQGTVQAQKDPAKVRVRVADGRIFNYNQTDLDGGKLKRRVVAANPLSGTLASAPPVLKAEETKHGQVDLPGGSDVTITVGDITITVKNNAKV